MRYDFGGLISGAAYTWRGLYSEFYGICLIRSVPILRSLASLGAWTVAISINVVGVIPPTQTAEDYGY